MQKTDPLCSNLGQRTIFDVWRRLGLSMSSATRSWREILVLIDLVDALKKKNETVSRLRFKRLSSFNPILSLGRIRE